MEATDEPTCQDCGTHDNVCMHNSREVKYGFLWLKTTTKRFPGFLCIPCWKLANPKLWKFEKKTGMIT